ncbi:hypothetical protein [Streptomyces sp. S1D4-14]|nr:hypothetical protein [Streptomyces sp. S1D4-14]
MLRIILVRKNEQAAYLQGEARETPRSYRHPEVRPVILANRIYKRRYGY